MIIDDTKPLVALIQWEHERGIGRAINYELEMMGYPVIRFSNREPIPALAQIVFLYGPFGKYLQSLEKLSDPRMQTVIFWNTEGLPDISWNKSAVRVLSNIRSWIGRIEGGWKRPFDRAFIRFRYLGDILYAHRKGLIDVMADISAVYAEYLSNAGVPTITAPFGSSPTWFDDRSRERDIDVLWMGKFGSRRREKILRQLRAELRARGIDIYMVDNIEHPFVYDDARTELLHRTKITLNVLRTWYDENSLRICMAAPNGSMVISEPLLAHVPQYIPGTHYVSVTIPAMVDAIVYYLKNPAERNRIAKQAQQLSTNELTFAKTIKKIMDAALAHRATAGKWD